MRLNGKNRKTIRRIALIIGGCFFAICTVFLVRKGIDSDSFAAVAAMKNNLLLLSISLIGYLLSFSHGREGGIVVFAGGSLIFWNLTLHDSLTQGISPMAVIPLMVTGLLLWLGETRLKKPESGTD